MQYHFSFEVRPTLRLSKVEAILRRTRALGEVPPVRTTLIKMIDDGRLEGRKVNGRWLVYEDSFNRLIQEMQQPTI